MILKQEIAKVKSAKTIWAEDFSKPKLKWELVDDEDEHAWMEDGVYNMKNLTESHWHFYALGSGLDFKNDDYFINTHFTFNVDFGSEFSSVGLVFGFKKYFKRLNRFVVDTSLQRAVIADFWREDSQPINRRSVRLDKKKFDGNLSRENYCTMGILKVGNRISFFINNFKTPVFETDLDFFNFDGDRLGFFVEPCVELRASLIHVRKLETEIVNELNIGELSELFV